MTTGCQHRMNQRRSDPYTSQISTLRILHPRHKEEGLQRKKGSGHGKGLIRRSGLLIE